MTDQAPAYAIAVDQLQARAEAAEKERDALKLENDMLNEQLEAAYPGMLRRMESAEKERDELRAQLEAATAAREGWRTQYDQTAALLHAAKCRIADLEADDGPGGNEHQAVVFERNQLRDENAELRTKLADIERCNSHASDACDAYASENRQLRLTVHNLKTLAHAIVDAVAKETP